MDEENKSGNIEYGKTYYFDKTGLSINEADIQDFGTKCKPVIESCCRLQLPKGFVFSEECPGMCFNLSKLECKKVPILQKITLKNNECNHPMECEVVAGYEIRAIGEVQFSVSVPICPVNGCCFHEHSNTCCNTTALINKPVSLTCCPDPCPCDVPCIDWCFAFFKFIKMKDECGEYIYVKMGLVLEYSGVCECDEE